MFNSILSSEIITNIKVGEKYNFNKSEIFFKKIEEKEESNFNSIIGHFRITDEKGKVVKYYDFKIEPMAIRADIEKLIDWKEVKVDEEALEEQFKMLCKKFTV